MNAPKPQPVQPNIPSPELPPNKHYIFGKDSFNDKLNSVPQSNTLVEDVITGRPTP